MVFIPQCCCSRISSSRERRWEVCGVQHPYCSFRFSQQHQWIASLHHVIWPDQGLFHHPSGHFVFRSNGYLRLHRFRDCHDFLLLDLVALLGLDLPRVGVERSFDWCDVRILLKPEMQSRLNRNGVLTVQKLFHRIHRYLTRFFLLRPLLQLLLPLLLLLLIQLYLCFPQLRSDLRYLLRIS